MSGDTCTECEAANGCTDGRPTGELDGDKEHLLLSPQKQRLASEGNNRMPLWAE